MSMELHSLRDESVSTTFHPFYKFTNHKDELKEEKHTFDNLFTESPMNWHKYPVKKSLENLPLKLAYSDDYL